MYVLDFVDYFEDTFIGRVIRNNSRRAPRFSVNMWNCFSRLDEELPRTNNSSEGWNRAIKNSARENPSIYESIADSRIEQHSNLILAEQLEAVGSVIVLALIPVYITSSHLAVSYQDKTRPFQSVSQFSAISKRSITSCVDPVDSTTFPVLQNFIRDKLTKWTKLPMSVQVIVDEAYVDNSNQTLFMIGKYVFSSFCKDACQNKAMNSMLQINGHMQTLNNLSISNLNENIAFNVNKNFKNVNLLSLSFVENQLQDPIDFIFGIQLERNLGLQRKRRQTHNTSEQESSYKLIQQMLSLTNKVKNVPFIVVDNRLTQMTVDSQLTVTVRLQYPIYCSTLCLEESVTDLYATLLGYSKINEFTSTRGITKYKITKLDLEGIGESVPVSLFTLRYSIENTPNITEGPITDEASLVNIKNGIKDSMNSTIEIEVIKASFASPENSSQNHNRRRRMVRWVLIVVIRFVVVFSCDRRSQQNTFIPIISNIRSPTPPFLINSITIIVLKPIICEYIRQTKPTLILTTTAAPTTTITHAISTTPYQLTTTDNTEITTTVTSTRSQQNGTSAIQNSSTSNEPVTITGDSTATTINPSTITSNEPVTITGDSTAATINPSTITSNEPTTIPGDSTATTINPSTITSNEPSTITGDSTATTNNPSTTA
ncbi:unnamed protein product [Rotaria magnacalcarata]|uniref:Uncharacterized protein n=4 Tax=Rotaria magnacalcarata TaxID=392030 RepID=A0A819ZVI0_9BILA|nr:unnamed protein product [Rotaria magnacalcarata]